MGEFFADLVTDGPLLVAAAVAALVGLISFASPCVLPLVPGYLPYVAGRTGGVGAVSGQRREHRSEERARSGAARGSERRAS